MARIIYTLGELAGSIGNLTFQKNNTGNIVRQKPLQRKTSTRKQQQRHSQHQTLLSGWNGLSLSEKLEWNLYAATFQKTNKFGQDKVLTGQNWYTSLNFWNLLLGDPFFTLPPAHIIPPGNPDFEIFIQSEGIYITILSAFDFTDNNLLIWATKPIANIKGFNQVTRRLIKIQTASAGAPINITSEWENATGLPWSPDTMFPNNFISVCLQSMNKTSKITGVLTCNTGTTASGDFSPAPWYYYS